MKCKRCKKEFHYCSSCGTDGYSEDGFCSDECKKEYLDYPGFYKYFKKMLHKTDSCFERDVLRESKEDLWESWCYWEEKRLVALKNTTVL